MLKKHYGDYFLIYLFDMKIDDGMGEKQGLEWYNDLVTYRKSAPIFSYNITVDDD